MLKRYLELERLFGADFLPSARPSAPAPAAPAPLDALRAEVAGCTRCGLHTGRTQTVFGVGSISPPLLFIGEAPGQDEDLQGEPFVGRAGQLLTRTLAKLGVRRDQVYIANILKCRPPNNRTPQGDEMAACLPFLRSQIGLLKPRVICLLGNVALKGLLNPARGITALRGRETVWEGVPTIPAFHPAYVLRNMNALPEFEADLELALRRSGLRPA